MNKTENEIYRTLIDLAGEPNDENTRQEICRRLLRYAHSNTFVYDVSTEHEVNKNSGKFEIEILGQRFVVRVSPSPESDLFDLDVSVTLKVQKLQEPNLEYPEED